MKRVEKFFQGLIKDHPEFEQLKSIPVEVVKIPGFYLDEELNLSEEGSLYQMITYRCTDEKDFGSVLLGAKKVFLMKQSKLEDNNIEVQGDLIIRNLVDNSFKIRMIIIK